MVARIVPHLRGYVRVRSALADAGALGASLTELLDNTHAGVIQLVRGGRVVDANDSARELLRRDDGLSDAGDGLRCRLAGRDDTWLQALLARVLPRLVGRGASGSMLPRRRSSPPRLALHVKPVADGWWTIARGTCRRSCWWSTR